MFMYDFKLIVFFSIICNLRCLLHKLFNLLSPIIMIIIIHTFFNLLDIRNFFYSKILKKKANLKTYFNSNDDKKCLSIILSLYMCQSLIFALLFILSIILLNHSI